MTPEELEIAIQVQISSYERMLRQAQELIDEKESQIAQLRELLNPPLIVGKHLREFAVSIAEMKQHQHVSRTQIAQLKQLLLELNWEKN